MQHMFNLMDVDIPIIGALFCFSIIIIGQIFLLNLILAVIIQAFMTSQQMQVKADIKLLELGAIEVITMSSEASSQMSKSQSEEEDNDEEGLDKSEE
jgi:hypothetical protein